MKKKWTVEKHTRLNRNRDEYSHHVSTTSTKHRETLRRLSYDSTR